MGAFILGYMTRLRCLRDAGLDEAQTSGAGWVPRVYVQERRRLEARAASVLWAVMHSGGEDISLPITDLGSRRLSPTRACGVICSKLLNLSGLSSSSPHSGEKLTAIVLASLDPFSLKKVAGENIAN